MAQTVVPMIHVPDVRAAAAWYESIGFVVTRTNEEDDEINWAALSFGGSELMFDAGGRSGAERRREVDLYIRTDEVEAVYERLKNRVEVIEPVHDTFYGMREVVVRDLNGFWVTFGEEVVGGGT